jgi:hypothetical protein
MVFYNLRVGSFSLKYSPFKDKKNEFPYCDKDAHILKRVSGHLEKGYFINEQTGERHDRAYLLINGKAFEKFLRTKETDKYREVENNEIFDLANPKMYYVESDKLLTELQNSGKALKFIISFGGQQSYLAYVFVNPLYNCLMMYIGNAKVSEQMLQFQENQKNLEKIKELTLTIDGIKRANAEIENLIVL